MPELSPGAVVDRERNSARTTLGGGAASVVGLRLARQRAAVAERPGTRATVFSDCEEVVPEQLLEALESDAVPMIAGRVGSFDAASPAASEPYSVCGMKAAISASPSQAIFSRHWRSARHS